MSKAIYGSKSGVITQKLNASDIDQVNLLDANAGNLYDLISQDGVISENPNAKALKDADAKQRKVIQQLQTADDATINAVDALINPVP